MGVKDKVLVFMKRGYSDVRLFLEQNFDCKTFEGDWGDPFPNITWEHVIDWEGNVYDKSIKKEYDWIFSWLCPWKIPKEALGLVRKGAINFHPGPPKYPGIGCYNYAIWNEDNDYAVTCHYMDEKLDHGDIIAVRYIRMYSTDTILTLKNRAIVRLKMLFYDIMHKILNDFKLELGIIQEVGEPYVWGKYKNKKDFQEFCDVSGEIYDDNTKGGWSMNDNNTERKLRATYFKGARDLPFIEINGKKWCLIPKTDL